MKVTFDPSVGQDTWWEHVNTTSKMPELIEKQLDAGRVATVPLEWTEVNGLKFAQKYQNAGLPGEVSQVSGLAIGAPDDSLYIPRVR